MLTPADMTQEKLQRQRLQSMVDSDCVGCPIARKSVSSAATRFFGWLFKFNVAGQACHAQSAGEGEYYVLTVGAADNLQVRQLLNEFGVNVEGDLFSVQPERWQTAKAYQRGCVALRCDISMCNSY